jgi:hypothetical protein
LKLLHFPEYDTTGISVDVLDQLALLGLDVGDDDDVDINELKVRVQSNYILTLF